MSRRRGGIYLGAPYFRPVLSHEVDFDPLHPDILDARTREKCWIFLVLFILNNARRSRSKLTAQQSLMGTLERLEYRETWLEAIRQLADSWGSKRNPIQRPAAVDRRWVLCIQRGIRLLPRKAKWDDRIIVALTYCSGSIRRSVHQRSENTILVCIAWRHSMQRSTLTPAPQLISNLID